MNKICCWKLVKYAAVDLDLDWVKSQNLPERVIVGPSDLSVYYIKAYISM